MSVGTSKNREVLSNLRVVGSYLSMHLRSLHGGHVVPGNAKQRASSLDARHAAAAFAFINSLSIITNAVAAAL
jgi:hypothetical protein